jgi:hypothetical protein
MDHSVILALSALLALGRVDGFDEDEAQSQRDERAVVFVGLLTT